MKRNSLKLLSIILILGILLTGCNKEKFIHIASDESFEQSIDLEDESEFADLAIMDSDIKGKKIFFTGEIHGCKANKELNMKLF